MRCCVVCGKPLTSEPKHHRWPRARGAPWGDVEHEYNKVDACITCHETYHNVMGACPSASALRTAGVADLADRLLFRDGRFWGMMPEYVKDAWWQHYGPHSGQERK